MFFLSRLLRAGLHCLLVNQNAQEFSLERAFGAIIDVKCLQVRVYVRCGV